VVFEWHGADKALAYHTQQLGVELVRSGMQQDLKSRQFVGRAGVLDVLHGLGATVPSFVKGIMTKVAKKSDCVCVTVLVTNTRTWEPECGHVVGNLGPLQSSIVPPREQQLLKVQTATHPLAAEARGWQGSKA